VACALQKSADVFGLPKKHFSCKSLRSGFSTHAKVNGMSSSEVNKRCGWAEGSTVPDKHYVRNMHSRGAFALSVSDSGNQR
jgi:integrase